MRIRTLALTLLPLSAVFSTSAQTTDVSLSAAALAALPPQASAEFAQAIGDFDHAYPDGGMRHLVAAADLAEGLHELQLLAGSVVLDEVSRLRGSQAVEALEWAQIAFQRVLDSEDASRTETIRAESGLRDLGRVAVEFAAREVQLRASGDDFIRDFSLYQERVQAARARRTRELRQQREQGTATPDASGRNPLLLPSDESEQRYESTGRQSRSEQGVLPDSDYTTRDNRSTR